MVAIGRAVSLLSLLVTMFVMAVAPPGGLDEANAASVVATSHCRSLDPNLVHGACLQYQARSGTAYTWIGSFRASNGRVFFCIDYLYDSRITGTPTISSTGGLVNQLGKKVGHAEVAALNYVVSTWASRGSTGSDSRDAAIGLIIRELMSDGIRPDGTVVYPRGLRVGQRVRPPVGGLGGPIMARAQEMWRAASQYYGGYRLTMSSNATGPIELGTSRRYDVSVLSAAGHRVPGVRVQFVCTGPITCPGPVTTRTSAVAVVMTPRDLGESTISASASGPDGGGQIYRVGSWRTHPGPTAEDRGIQRGWIGQRRATVAQVRASAEIVKGTPDVVTRASEAVASPGTSLHDRVSVTHLPPGYQQSVTATLYGPFPTAPGAASCTPDAVAGTVTFPLQHDGDTVTPGVVVTAPGSYVWVESLPGDLRTNPVTTPCGVVAETTVVSPRTPTVRTQVSAQRTQVGRPLHDTVVLAGLGAGDAVTVSWSLLGPLAPQGDSCAGLDWSGAGVAARGTFAAARNGTFRTVDAVVRMPGCFTYAETIAATRTTAATAADAGQAAETAVVTRPVTPLVPEIPSGPYVAGRPTGGAR